MGVNVTEDGVPSASYVFFPIIIITDAVYVVVFLLNSTTRRKPNYSLRLATVITMFLQACFTLSAHIGINEVAASWIHIPASCDVMYILCATFSDVILVLFIIIVAERLYDVRVYLYSISWTVAAVLITAPVVVSIVWEAVAQDVLSDGVQTVPVDEEYVMCILQTNTYPLYSIYAVKETLLLAILYLTSVAGLIVRYSMGDIADEVLLPAGTGLIVTFLKAPNVILFVGDLFWNVGYEVTYVLFYLSMFTSIIVPFLWIMADPRARAIPACWERTDDKYDVEKEIENEKEKNLYEVETHM